MKGNLRVKCSKDNLALIREFVKAKLEEFEIVGKICDQIVLATDEACANCIIHQHNCNGYSTIDVSIYLEEESVYVEIKDKGKAYPIHNYPRQHLDEMVKKRKKGGLGLVLINKLMDEVKIEERHDHFIYKLGKRLYDAHYC